MTGNTRPRGDAPFKKHPSPVGDRLRVLIVGYGLDGTDVGEVFSGFKLVEALSHHADLTVITTRIAGRKPIEEQLPLARVITWKEPAFARARFERINAIAKPFLPIFARWAHRRIKAEIKAGARFDFAHQVLPQAMRYATPLRDTGVPYAIGPLGGSLETPPGLASEVSAGSLMTRLRTLDRPRLAVDPWLRATFSQAAIVFGVAPYIRDALAGIPLKRFEIFFERGHDGLAPLRECPGQANVLKLLHVGRAVRTKGLQDVIRALSLLPDLPGVTLTSAGDGPDLAAARDLATQLGVSDRVTFLGKVPREDVDALYEAADVFAFPSFREPMGGVLFEAMNWSLPIVTANYGGPGAIVDETCGIRIAVTEPQTYARDIAVALRRLAEEPLLRARLARGAHQRLATFGSWDEKAQRLVALYREALAAP